jgi:menaquinone-dependent protoporphyrinogen oxidase
MALTGGPTDPTTVVDYTDWAAVDAFAAELRAALAGAESRPVG